MPLGPCNETQTMSKLTDRVIVYLVDLLLVSATFERHLDIFKEVACHINRADMTINIGKSKFCGKRVKYLVHIVDPEKISAPFNIHCDANKTGVGEVLDQLSPEGDECPIAFVSKKLNKAQQNYSVSEQKC